VLAEAQILRDADQWQQSYDLLLQHMRQSPEDGGLIYELAMTAEHLQRYDDAEVLLRRAMQLDPRDAQAYNALGYSLAERNERLDEAHSLVQKALDLMPEDAFIQDSMGWVLFRQGQHERARNILQQAFDARPHPEIAAHLGEVLWVMGRPEQARAIWRDGLKRDAKQDTLRQTLERLKVQW
jgi:Flp pilus assembly protein TadD